MISCELLVVRVPSNEAGSDGQARAKALIFAQFAAQIGFPDVVEQKRDEKGWLVSVAAKGDSAERWKKEAPT